MKYTADERRLNLLPDARTGVIRLDAWTYAALFDLACMNAEDRRAFADPRALTVQCGGWQSWSAGWELGYGETLPRKVRLIHDLILLTNRPDDMLDMRGAELRGHFIMYIRSGDRYLCIASRGGGDLPPVSCRINRETQLVSAEIYCPGKTWTAGDLMGELFIFFARGYFKFKDTISTIYQQEASFRNIDFLCGESRRDYRICDGNHPGGYESWYNHYTNINERLILDDLKGLGATENLIRLRYTDKGKPAVFQIDDGWERAVGDWEIDARRFPNGLASIAAQTEAAGFIPGLWIAPFLLTKGSPVFAGRPEWLLRDERGRPVSAGFNPLWDGRFYCLDLSRGDVMEYLKAIIDRIIDEWGFRYLKLDFLYAGFLPGHYSGAANSTYELYEKACALLTARTTTTAGLPVTYLGCGVPLGPSFRRFPLSRIGADTRETWEWKPVTLIGHTGGPGAYVNLLDTIGRSFMNGTIYVNDPDVLFLRSNNCKLTEGEKELIALVNFLLAGQLMFSDDPRRLTHSDLALTKRIAALYEQLAGDEYGAVRLERNIFRLESRSGRTAGIINLGKRPYCLEKTAYPELFAALGAENGGGRFLIDHRIRVTTDRIHFAAHTITIGLTTMPYRNNDIHGGSHECT
jgi:alpha-galactosidase